MARYLAYRVGAMVPIVIGVTLVVFIVGHLAPGDPVQVLFGDYRGIRVGAIIAAALPVSLALGTLALLLAVLAGVPLGLAAALRRGSALDQGVRLLTCGRCRAEGAARAPSRRPRSG